MSHSQSVEGFFPLNDDIAAESCVKIRPAQSSSLVFTFFTLFLFLQTIRRACLYSCQDGVSATHGPHFFSSRETSAGGPPGTESRGASVCWLVCPVSCLSSLLTPPSISHPMFVLNVLLFCSRFVYLACSVCLYQLQASMFECVRAYVPSIFMTSCLCVCVSVSFSHRGVVNIVRRVYVYICVVCAGCFSVYFNFSPWRASRGRENIRQVTSQENDQLPVLSFFFHAIMSGNHVLEDCAEKII